MDVHKYSCKLRYHEFPVLIHGDELKLMHDLYLTHSKRL